MNTWKFSFACALFCSFAAFWLTTVPLVADEKAAEPSTVKAGDLTLTVPKQWKQQQPSNNLRLAQFVIPAPKEGVEAGELVISGPFGGSANANVQRWLTQFDPTDRELSMTQGDSKQGKYVLVDMVGTYKRTVGPPIRQQTESVSGFRVINVMIGVNDGRGGNYFLKLTGPKETIDPVAETLRSTFGADASQEKPFEL